MVRKLKPKEELSKSGKYSREYFRKNPDRHKEVKKHNKEYYLKTKSRQQFTKKLKTKEQRESAIKNMSGKWMSCGEI